MRPGPDLDPRALQATRREASLTQRELAAAVGVTVAMVSRWERGVTAPRPDSLSRVAAALGTVVADLQPGDRRDEPDLRAFRVTRGLTAHALAQRSGVPRSTIHHLERGLTATVPRRHTLTALADALALTPDEVALLIRRSAAQPSHKH